MPPMPPTTLRKSEVGGLALRFRLALNRQTSDPLVVAGRSAALAATASLDQPNDN